MTVALRPVVPRDLATLDRWAVAIGAGAELLSRTRPLGAGADRHDPGHGLFWFVIVHDGADVGTVWIEPGERPGTSVLGVYLGDPAYFGRGIGTAAIRLAIDAWRATAMSRDLVLRVRSDNARAIACYEKVGFARTSSGEKTLTSGERVSFIAMRLSL